MYLSVRYSTAISNVRSDVLLPDATYVFGGMIGSLKPVLGGWFRRKYLALLLVYGVWDGRIVYPLTSKKSYL